MGDRGNIVMRYESNSDKDIYFYTHWRGSQIGEIVHAALSKRWRWNDAIYLSRIIFCELVKGEIGEETGFGISPFIGDNEHSLLIVDTANRTILQCKEGDEAKNDKIIKKWTFEEFIAESPIEIWR